MKNDSSQQLQRLLLQLLHQRGPQMEQLNRAQRRQPDLWVRRTHGDFVDGFDLVAPVSVAATGAVVVTATRQQRRLQARMQAKDATRRTAKGVTA